MAETALYEESSRGESIRLRSNCEDGARRFKVQSILAGAAAYLLTAFVAVLLADIDISAIQENPVTAAVIAAAVLAVGVVFTIVYVRVVKKVIASRYRNVRSSMVRYDLQRRKLRQIMQEGKTESNLAE